MISHRQDSIKAIRQKRNKENAVQSAAALVFVKMAESAEDAFDVTTLAEHESLFSEWASGVQFTTGQIRKYGGKLYKCVQPHTSQDDWTPEASPSLWSLSGDPGEEYPEWFQPVGAHDAYITGDKAAYNNKHWVSTVNGNVWEPGVYGWEEVT
jgi:hypothetical protein